MTEDPLKTDLYSLRILRTVYEYGSFSAASEALGLNQSVVSYAIDRLRTTFQDRLFLRQGRGVVATDRCETIAAMASNLLDEFEALVSPAEVDPAKLDRSFRIGCNFIERVLIVPLIAKALRDRAPLVNLTVVQAGTSGIRQLSQGTIDLLIGPIRPDSDRFFCRSLIRDHYVCVMDPANPMAQQDMTLDGFLSANRVEVSYGDEWTSDYRAQLDPLSGRLAEAKVTVPSPGEIGRIIQGTDLVATIPALYAGLLTPDLLVKEFPLASALEIDLVWSRRTHGSAAQKWFRDLVVGASAPLQAVSRATDRKVSSS